MARSLQKSRPTQKDIARALGISQAAVAMALNAKTQWKLTPETVALVQAKAVEMNYTPQRQASILRSGRSHTIGVLWKSDLYHAPRERVRLLAQGAIEAGYQLIAIDSTWFGDDRKAIQDYLLAMAVEGVVFCNLRLVLTDGWEEFLKVKGIPGISFSSTTRHFDLVEQDLVLMFRSLTRHHLDQGSRHLHLVLSYHHPISSPDDVDLLLTRRVSGFVQEIQSVGGEIIADADTAKLLRLPAHVPKGPDAVKGWIHYPLYEEAFQDAFDVGYLTTQRLLSQCHVPVDSLVCSNDDIAMGALRACYEQGVKIPATIKVSGVDNAPFARHNFVPITTIEQDNHGMAQWCIRRLVELIENPDERAHQQQQLFPAKLIVRRSTQASPDLSPTP